MNSRKQQLVTTGETPWREDRRTINVDRSLLILQKKMSSLNVLVWLHVPDKLRPSGALGCLVESHRQAQVVTEA